MSIKFNLNNFDETIFPSRFREHSRRLIWRISMLRSWSHSSRLLKRTFDVLATAVGLLFLWPLFCVIGMAVLLFEGGPVFIRHERVGRNSSPFMCYKFRTMVPDAGAVLERHLTADPRLRDEWCRDQKLSDDPRVTPLGKFLRATSLDELPQLINVLKGEMSLVGPRPIVKSEKDRYGDKFDLCFSVRPGITGLWQVSGRNNCSYGRRVELDASYVRDRSFAGDMRILVRTIPAVIMRRGSC